MQVIKYELQGSTLYVTPEGGHHVSSIPDNIPYTSLIIGDGIRSVDFTGMHDNISYLELPKSCRQVSRCKSVKSLKASSLTKNVHHLLDNTEVIWYEEPVRMQKGNHLIIHSSEALIVPTLKEVMVEHLEIRGSYKRISPYAFSGLPNLKTVTIKAPIKEFMNHAYFDCKNLTFTNFPPTLTKIGEYCFCSCESLLTATIPDSVVSIEKAAFFGCKQLVAVKWPYNCTRIPSNCFAYCEELSEVSIPTSIRQVESCAFYHCKSLKDIPQTIHVTQYGHNCFNGCVGMIDVHVPTGVKQFTSTIFTGCDNIESLTLPYTMTHFPTRIFRTLPQIKHLDIPAHLECEAGRRTVTKTDYIPELLRQLPPNPNIAYLIEHKITDPEIIFHMLSAIYVEVPEVETVLEVIANVRNCQRHAVCQTNN